MKKLFFVILIFSFSCNSKNSDYPFQYKCDKIDESILNYKGVPSICLKCNINENLIEMIVESDSLQETYKEYYFGDFLEKATFKKHNSNIRYIINLDEGKGSFHPSFNIQENYTNNQIDIDNSLMLLVDSVNNEYLITFCGKSSKVDSIKVIGLNSFNIHLDNSLSKDQKVNITSKNKYFYTFNWDVNTSLKGHIIRYMELKDPNDSTRLTTAYNIVYFDSALLNRIIERHTTEPKINTEFSYKN